MDGRPRVHCTINGIRFIIRILENMKFQNATRGGNSLKQKSEDFFRAASNIEFCVLPRLDSPGCVHDKTHRQRADFLGAPSGTACRQYKTRGTETRYHLPLKTRQMITRRRAVMLCSVVPTRAHNKAQIVCGLRTRHVECSNLKMIRDVRRGMVRNTGFCA